MAPAAGDGVRFSAVVRNQGTAPTPAGVIHGVLFTVDGMPVTWSDNFSSSLAPGQSVTLTANGGPQSAVWAARSGNHTVVAFVDDVNRITDEFNESNNTLSRTLKVKGAGSAR